MRQATLKVRYLKTKIVATMRGRKVFESNSLRRHDELRAFRQGWEIAMLNRDQHDSHVWRHLHHVLITSKEQRQ
jgi:hypothetical protein